MRHVQHICFLIKIIKIIIQCEAKQFQSPFNFMLHCLQRNILTKWLTLVCSHIWNKWHNLKMCINKYEEIRVQNISSESQQTTAVTRVSTSRALTTMNNRWMQMMRRRPNNASLNLAPIFSHFLPISSSHNRTLWSLTLLALPSPFVIAQFKII